MAAMSWSLVKKPKAGAVSDIFMWHFYGFRQPLEGNMAFVVPIGPVGVSPDEATKMI